MPYPAKGASAVLSLGDGDASRGPCGEVRAGTGPLQVHKDDPWELSLMGTKELQGCLESADFVALDDWIGGEK